MPFLLRSPRQQPPTNHQKCKTRDGDAGADWSEIEHVEGLTEQLLGATATQ